MNKIINLVNDLILLEKERDKEWKTLMLSAKKASQATGDSMMLYHLNTLKELCEEEDRRLATIIDTNK